MFLRGTARKLGRAFLLLRRAIVLPLAVAACVPAAPPSTDQVAALVAPPQPSVSAYTQMIRDYGIPLDIPQRGKFILVNIPSFELIAFENGTPVLRSRVVVGRPSTETPDLYSHMWALKYNPDWTPTANMIRNESAVYVKPGPNNPLGLLKFELDNNQAIYLHDTNRKELFDRERRAYSHGCVRVQNYLDLASWVAGIPVSDIQTNINTGRTYIDRLPEPIPVYLSYFIFFPDESGRLQSYPDMYGRSGTVPAGYKVISPASNEAAAVIAPLMPGEVALPMQVSTGKPVPPPRPSAPRPTVTPAAATPTAAPDGTTPEGTVPGLLPGTETAPLVTPGTEIPALGGPSTAVPPADAGAPTAGAAPPLVGVPATGAEPAAIEPAAIEPPATEPPATEPPAIEPPAIEPVGTDPAATGAPVEPAPPAAATGSETCVADSPGCPTKPVPVKP